MAKSRTPLLDALLRRRQLNIVPFHMPGHKSGKGVSRKFSDLLKADPFAIDLTEVPGMDDLHQPVGVISESQARAAKVFGADKSYFLVNGTTAGIHAAILGTCRPGDELLMPRDVHRSVIGGCILTGVKPRYIEVGLDEEYCIPVPVTMSDVNCALEKAPGVKALLQVHPSYYGLAVDLESIVKAAHLKSIPVIVDEAHGAHFTFSKKLPPSGMAVGADICVQSTHKTLGSLTQASMLHIKGGFVSENGIFSQLRILQSTSPSYILMSSLDAAIGQMEVSGTRLVDRVIRLAENARRHINEIPGIRCLSWEKAKGEGLSGMDPTKLLISMFDLGITGYQAAQLLLDRYQIQVELSDRFNILCMLSIGTSRADILKLVKALKEIAFNGYRAKNTRPFIPGRLKIPTAVMTPRDAWFAPKKSIPLKEALGAVSAEIISPYPPGVPVICPGEEITQETLEILRQFKACQHSFHCCTDPCINTIQVVDC